MGIDNTDETFVSVTEFAPFSFRVGYQYSSFKNVSMSSGEKKSHVLF